LAPVRFQVDVEAVAQERDARVPELLRDEVLDALVVREIGGEPHSAILSATHAMHAVRACTSAGSVTGNMPSRSWLRPSLRYGSTSTMPFSRSVAASADASTRSSKSTVPTTSERLAGSATNGAA